MTTGGGQASSLRATDQRAESRTCSAEEALTEVKRGRGVQTSQTSAGGESSSPRTRSPSKEYLGQSAKISFTASLTRSENKIADDAAAVKNYEGREIARDCAARFNTQLQTERTTYAAISLNSLTF